MKTYLGIDLGSTTSKAVLIDEKHNIIGRGITNTRSNYEVAAEIARMEAEFNSRFTILLRRMKESSSGEVDWNHLVALLEGRFHYLQFEERFAELKNAMLEQANHASNGVPAAEIVDIIRSACDDVEAAVKDKFFNNKVSSTSEFFRDLFSEPYMHAIQNRERDLFDHLVAIYDRCITPVENKLLEFNFIDLTEQALDFMPEELRSLRKEVAVHLAEVAAINLEPADFIGTGYGRQLLPFDQKHIKSEILCHAMGAHTYFPKTRTVLDIGGQDTKAIQVDEHGLVTSFQMNDRCAAGCGRYLGYISDEMSMSVGELGPLALKAEYESNICSTCTVFAGAELREYLNLGEKKENILAGLHKAIVQRAFGLLARSGGVRNEMTFTGGVARNPAVVKYVEQLVIQNYGDIKINLHADSIFMGALGAAIFSEAR